MNHDFERRNISEWFLNGICLIIWFFIWKPISLFFSFLKQLITDVAKGVYGKVVTAMTAVVFVSLLAYLSNFLG